MNDLNLLTTDQLDKLHKDLKDKTDEVYHILHERLVTENRRDYLEKWANLALLTYELKDYFLKHGDVNDFILENGAKYDYIIWTCKWMLQHKGDYVKYNVRKYKYRQKYKTKYRTNIQLSDIQHQYNSDYIDIELMKNITEYVIYTAITKDPTILKIGEHNVIFSKFHNL